MLRILLASTDKDSLFDLKTGFEEGGAQIVWAVTCGDIFLRLKEEKFDLIVIDEKLPEMNGLECIEKLIYLNPMLNCASISSLSPDEFHEASEGLGLLMQLPEKPDKEDALKLLDHLKIILNLTKKVS
ncbi:MAG: response regulator [Desulfobacterales bacterium]|jgi:CheY-like chemotaxis protein|nr:response regulator [Desulfobacteraceae bacterium]MBT4365380.1 response regulator [Desulfobacteraceae bacterium]MBT7087124.1 response regulator [Desulfobacterales bacterium]MBT7697768.1 response regulator [Desulfobacterales bacterium]